MPRYDYSCQDCGPFSEQRPMSEFDLPQPCPECGASSPRALLSAPRLGRGASEPSSSQPYSFASHGGGCGCCAPRPMRAEAVDS